jgi:leader peptidase (prepilin peptidase) / N-methyltransferase
MNPQGGLSLMFAAAGLGGLVSTALHAVTVSRFMSTPRARLLLQTRRAILLNVSIAAVLSGAVAWRVGPHPVVIAICALAALAPVLSMVDIAEQRLPNPLTIGSYPVLAAVLVIAAAFTDDWPALLRAAIGFIALPAFYLSIAAFARGGFGAGDVKLAAAAGLVLGYRSITALTVGTMVALLCGALIGMAMIAARRAGAHTQTPYGPALLLGTLLAATG